MFEGLIKSLAKNGLESLGEQLFDTAANKGIDFVQSKLKQATGLDIDFKKELTPSQVKVVKSKEGEIIDSLEVLKETNRHVEKMLAIDIETDRIAAADRDSARNRQVEAMNHGNWLNKNFLEVISLMLIIGIGVFEYKIMHLDPKAFDIAIVTSVQKFVEYIGVGLIGFWFGSSKGSKDKTKAITGQK